MVRSRGRKRLPDSLLTALTLPAALVAGPVLGAGFTLRNLTVSARDGIRAAVVAVLNLPFDLLTNTLGFVSSLGFFPVFVNGPEAPGIGLRRGSLIFLGGPAGALVSTFAAAFTPTSTVFISRRSWERRDAGERDRLVNHELWHARRQFLRYSGWLFWPAYLASNVIYGTHRKNPFESGVGGAYRNVDDDWERYCGSGLYAESCDPFWKRP